MIRCNKCKSYAVEPTGVCYTTYPEQYEYVCSDCGEKFLITNGKLNFDLSNSHDVSVLFDLRKTFFKSILTNGEIPNSLHYCDYDYHFYKCVDDNYYYVNDKAYKNTVIHLHADTKQIQEADSLFEQIQDFYELVGSVV